MTIAFARLGGAMLAAFMIPVLAAAPAVPLATVTYDNVPGFVAAEGSVEATRQAAVAAQVMGRVVDMPVRIGDIVKAGQLLARIDPRSADLALAGSRAQLRESQVALDNTTITVQRNRQLYARGFISQAALDRFEADFKTSEAQLASVQSQAGQALNTQSLTNLTAPFGGVVGVVNTELGEMATPGKPVITLYDPAALRVTATIPQSRLGAIDRNAEVRVEIPGQKDTIKARFTTLVPLADSRTHTAQIRLDLPQGSGILPGQYARVLFESQRTKKLVVPESALLKRGEITAVYVHATDDTFRLRLVQAGEPTTDGRIEILSGLREGEKVSLHPVKAGLNVAAN
jgi:RND family efflux transporter MFP subunit